MKAIIFGANGQDAFYLRAILRDENVATIGVSRSRGELVEVVGDVADFELVENLIKTAQPDFVFHLAANSTTKHAAIFDNHAAIATGAINILESVNRHSKHTKVFLSGSAVQFENDGTPIDENTAFAALSPYAVSRIESVYWARYFRGSGLQIYVGYFFNHDSSRRAISHVNQKIATAARNLEKIEIGDVSVRKEFGFAGDAMRAVWILVNQNRVFEVVIGTGEARSIADWLELCYSLSGQDWRDYVIINRSYKAEYKLLVSNPALLKSLGWQPATTIDDLAKMMMQKELE